MGKANSTTNSTGNIIQLSAFGGKFTGELDRVRGLSYTVGHIGGVWHWTAVKANGETTEANAMSKAAAADAAKTWLGWGNGA